MKILDRRGRARSPSRSAAALSRRQRVLLLRRLTSCCSFVVLATAWNILGGYAGYVNFGTGASSASAPTRAVVLFKALGAPLAVQIARRRR